MPFFSSQPAHEQFSLLIWLNQRSSMNYLLWSSSCLSASRIFGVLAIYPISLSYRSLQEVSFCLNISPSLIASSYFKTPLFQMKNALTLRKLSLITLVVRCMTRNLHRCLLWCKVELVRKSILLWKAYCILINLNMNQFIRKLVAEHIQVTFQSIKDNSLSTKVR